MSFVDGSIAVQEEMNGHALTPDRAAAAVGPPRPPRQPTRTPLLVLAAWKFFYFLLMYFLSLTFFTFMGQCLTFATPNQVGSRAAAGCTGPPSRQPPHSWPVPPARLPSRAARPS